MNERLHEISPVPAETIRRLCDALGYDWRTVTSILITPDTVVVHTIHPVLRDRSA